MNTVHEEIAARLIAAGKTTAQVQAMFATWSKIEKLGMQISKERKSAR